MWNDHPQDYWRLVAAEFMAKVERAGFYVRHSGEAGRLREVLFRDFVAENTPAGYTVKTGFIATGERVTSRQCDILAYAPLEDVPLYQNGNLVVVTSCSARAVVEVKTRFRRNNEFKHILQICHTVRKKGETWPMVLGVVIGGGSFKSLVDYVCRFLTSPYEFLQVPSDEFKIDLHWLPDLIGLLQANCIALRSSDPSHYLAVDFGRTKRNEGMALAAALRMYACGLRCKSDESTIQSWFDTMEARRKVRICVDGTVEDL
jgi:hypothetical protein